MDNIITRQQEEDSSPWFVVQNGRQIDIHYRSFKASREYTVLANLDGEHTANAIVKAHNDSLSGGKS